MAKNLTSRGTLVSITMNGSQENLENLVFTSKEALDQYLYALAVKHWNDGPLPSARRQVLERFFNGKFADVRTSPVTIVSTTAAQQRFEKACQLANRLLDEQNEEAEKTEAQPTKRSRKTAGAR
jgi:hypothetical protein